MKFGITKFALQVVRVRAGAIAGLARFDPVDQSLRTVSAANLVPHLIAIEVALNDKMSLFSVL